VLGGLVYTGLRKEFRVALNLDVMDLVRVEPFRAEGSFCPRELVSSNWWLYRDWLNSILKLLFVLSKCGDTLEIVFIT
jgi:hypothetical protein